MKHIPWIFGLIILAGLAASLAIATNHSLDVIEPVGEVANQQKNLLYFAIGLSMVVIIPVFAMAIYFAKKYHYKNKKAYYAPDWDTSRTAETIWWGVPIILILILSLVTWNTTHSLDPYKPLASSQDSLEVQVVALEWKWLFIYPEYNIASLNELTIPKDKPINFKITADAPMNSFWIPALGSQIYAMNGMQSQLNLVSNQEGVKTGRSANISGEGFSKMTFDTITKSPAEFNAWINNVKNTGFTLGSYRYDQLSQPSEGEVTYYSRVEPNLFNLILDKYSSHGGH